MIIKRNISTDISEVKALERITAYLVKAGYEQNTADDPTSFRRGSISGSWISFTPKGWKTTVTIQPTLANDKTLLTIVFDIDISGQFVSKKEKAFWESELRGLEQAVCDNIIEPPQDTGLVRNAMKHVFISAGFLLIPTIIFIVAAILIFETFLAACLGFILGMAIGLLALNRFNNFKPE